MIRRLAYIQLCPSPLPNFKLYSLSVVLKMAWGKKNLKRCINLKSVDFRDSINLNVISKTTKQYIKYRFHAPAKVSDSFEGSTALAAPLRCIFSRTHLFYSHLRRRRERRKISSSQVSAWIYRLLTSGNWKIPRLFPRQPVNYYWGENRPPIERSVGRMLPVVFPGESLFVSR